MESTQKIGQDKYFLKILTFRSTFVQKSTFGNWTFAQFLSFEWRNGFQNRNVLEKLSGTGPFWKFWLFGQGQGFTWSKDFLFPPFFYLIFFFLQTVRTGPDFRVGPGQTGYWGWHHPWRHRTRRVCQRMARGSACNDEGARRRVWARDMTLVISVRSGGACQRVVAFLGLKFWGFADIGPLDLVVFSVF